MKNINTQLDNQLYCQLSEINSQAMLEPIYGKLYGQIGSPLWQQLDLQLSSQIWSQLRSQLLWVQLLEQLKNI